MSDFLAELLAKTMEETDLSWTMGEPPPGNKIIAAFYNALVKNAKEVVEYLTVAGAGS